MTGLHYGRADPAEPAVKLLYYPMQVCSSSFPCVVVYMSLLTSDLLKKDYMLGKRGATIWLRHKRTIPSIIGRQIHHVHKLPHVDALLFFLQETQLGAFLDDLRYLGLLLCLLLG